MLYATKIRNLSEGVFPEFTFGLEALRRGSGQNQPDPKVSLSLYTCFYGLYLFLAHTSSHAFLLAH